MKGIIPKPASECGVEKYRIDLNELEESYTYMRAKLYGEGETVAGTQPFGIR